MSLNRRTHRLSATGLARLLAIFVAFIGFQTASAATVLELGTEDLVNQSELIIHGQVTDRWTEYDDERDTVFTHVRIAVSDVVKGAVSSTHIELQFEGGTYGNRRVQVSGMNVPLLGEEGIYFVERPDRVQINPLYGWQQGHYVVRMAEDGQTPLVMTYDLRPVFGFRSATRGSNVFVSSGGAPLGIKTAPKDNDTPMTVGEFKSALRSLVEVSE
ncbi:MAG: hypothetical protein AAF351_12340 [Pseudomonadota bacterium]